MRNGKQFIINITAQIVTFVLSFAISFFLTPYVTENLGVEAYGFIGLANNFVSYASLITVALNSMAGRFVTIKLYEKDIDGANRYFTSVMMANIVISSIIGVLSIILVSMLERLINVPKEILTDVKILFSALFLNCILNTIGSLYNVSIFATNKLYIKSVRQIESQILKAGLVLVLFFIFAPRVSFWGISVLISGIYVLVYDVYYTKKLLPQIKLKKKYLDFKSVIEVLSSGIWNVVTRMGRIMLDGIDLLISNLMISASSMGVLSIAKTIPSVIGSIIIAVAGVFSPSFTILYAEKKINELIKNLGQSIRIMGFLCNLPIIILIVCGKMFYSLWQPTQDATLLYTLSVLTVACSAFSGGINTLYSLFTVVNKIKANSLVVLSTGVLQLIVTFTLLKTTNLGLYAVAGVSTVITIIRNICFTAPYGAKCLNLKWYVFLKDIGKPVAFTIIVSIIGLFIGKLVKFSGWTGLILWASINVVIGIIVGSFVVFNKEDRKRIKGILHKLVKKG